MNSSVNSEQPLTPYTVLDLTEGGFNWCGKVLADLGADVIKVEPPGGSPTRNVGPFVDGKPGEDRSLFWASYCANKRSITLDLKDTDDAAQFRHLASRADVLIESFMPGQMDELGLGYDSISRSNPGLVYTSITPFGQTGPYSQFSAPDLIAWSMGGMQYLGGNEDRQPVRISAPQAQLHAGAHAAAGTMAALWHSRNTGIGKQVDVSMQTAVVWTLMNATPFPPLHGTNMERSGDYRARGHITVRHVFGCRDGYLSVVQAPRTLRGLAEWMEEESAAPLWLSAIDWDEWNPGSIGEYDSDAIDLFHRVQKRMEEFISSKTKNELYLRAIDHGILLAPCQTVQDIAESVQLEARGFWSELEHESLGRSLTHLGPFISMSESPVQIRLPAPRVGEHNEKILHGKEDISPGVGQPKKIQPLKSQPK
ncbi:MAG: CoA transferase, partial [Dehalococcoidia bacterium]|nr:CoA transferase [Dehalococcoidia bacterium]